MKLAMPFVLVCFLTSGCVHRQTPESVAYGYDARTCEELSRELGRTDPSFTRQQKSEVERAISAKGCIRPLAAETE